jgi:hypothetical protein
LNKCSNGNHSYADILCEGWSPMNQQAIAEFVQAVRGFGPVRAKYLPRNGKGQRLTGAAVTASDAAIIIHSGEGEIAVPFQQIEHISFATDDNKFFVRMQDAMVELRPDND